MSSSKNSFGGLPTSDVIDVCARLRPDTSTDVVEIAAKRALRSATAPPDAQHRDHRTRHRAAGPARTRQPSSARRLRHRREVAATLLIVAGDNPDRIRNEASLPALYNTSPIEASSGKTVSNPPQPQRKPPSQQRSLAHHHDHTARRRIHHRVCRPTARPRQNQPREPCAASNATSHAKSTTCSPTHPKSPTERPTPTTHTARTHPQRHNPSPQPPASQNKNEASATTATSPNVTNNTSPK